MESRTHIEFECNYCDELSNCTRHLCDFCGTCEETLFLISEGFDFALCAKCLVSLQIQMQKKLIQIKQNPRENSQIVSEEIKVLRKTISEDERKAVFDRDNWACVICGDTNNLQIDHKFPFSKGGSTEINNLQTLCKTCNCKKHAKII